MRTNATREKLQRGEPVMGLMMLGADPHVVGLIAATGFDFVMFDLEHTSLSYERLERLVQAADAAGVTPMTRVSSGQRSDILRALETGVRGLMVPMVETAADAANAARFARYAPAGERGAYFLSYPSAYGRGSMQEHAAASNRELLLITQIETVTGVANAAAIAATPGIDVVFVGPGDLSQSLGVPGELDHERVLSATQNALDAARAAGKWGGVIGPANAERWMNRGAPFVIWHQEMSLFKQALQTATETAHQQYGWTPRSD